MKNISWLLAAIILMLALFAYMIKGDRITAMLRGTTCGSTNVILNLKKKEATAINEFKNSFYSLLIDADKTVMSIHNIKMTGIAGTRTLCAATFYLKIGLTPLSEGNLNGEPLVHEIPFKFAVQYTETNELDVEILTSSGNCDCILKDNSG